MVTVRSPTQQSPTPTSATTFSDKDGASSLFRDPSGYPFGEDPDAPADGPSGSPTTPTDPVTAEKGSVPPAPHPSPERGQVVHSSGTVTERISGGDDEDPPIPERQWDRPKSLEAPLQLKDDLPTMDPRAANATEDRSGSEDLGDITKEVAEDNNEQQDDDHYEQQLQGQQHHEQHQPHQLHEQDQPLPRPYPVEQQEESTLVIAPLTPVRTRAPRRGAPARGVSSSASPEHQRPQPYTTRSSASPRSPKSH
ncbi:hypothetical protein BDK51DRAFT_41474, partial [Blyttiomyces helicus]